MKVKSLVVDKFILVGAILGKAMDMIVASAKNSISEPLKHLARQIDNCGDHNAWLNMNVSVEPFPVSHLRIYGDFWPSDVNQAKETVAIMVRGYIIATVRPMWSSTYVDHVMYYANDNRGRGNHDMSEHEVVQLVAEVLERTFCEDWRIPEGCENVNPIHPDWPMLNCFTVNSNDSRIIRFKVAGEYPFDKPNLVMKRQVITDQQAAVALGCTVEQVDGLMNKAYVVTQVDEDTKTAYAVYNHDRKLWYLVLDIEHMQNFPVRWLLDKRNMNYMSGEYIKLDHDYQAGAFKFDVFMTDAGNLGLTVECPNVPGKSVDVFIDHNLNVTHV